MDPHRRLAPVRRLLGARLRPLDAEPWLGARRIDPQAGWRGRVALDRARVEVRPDDADAWWRLGLGLHSVGRHDDASAAFLRALRRDIAAPRTRQAIVVTRDARGLDRTLELAAALATVPGVQPFWVCTTPVLFDRTLPLVEAIGARIYRVREAYLVPLLRDGRLPGVRLALATGPEVIASLPRRVRRVRIPRGFVEKDLADHAAFDVVLSPSKDTTRQCTNATPVVWPAATERSDPARTDDECVVLQSTASAESPTAWSDDALFGLIEGITTERPTVSVVLRPSTTRRVQAVEAWKRARAVLPRSSAVRVSIGFDREAVSPHAVVVEADPEAWASVLRTDRPVVVFDPTASDDATIWADLRARTALQVIDALHVLRTEPDRARAIRTAVTEALLYTASDPAAADLTDLLTRLATERAAEGSSA